MRINVPFFITQTMKADWKWDDPEIGVEWPMPEGMTKEELTISDKDQKWGSFAEYKNR